MPGDSVRQQAALRADQRDGPCCGVVHLVTPAQDAVLELGGVFADVVGKPHGVGPVAGAKGLGELPGHLGYLVQVGSYRFKPLTVVADVGHIPRDWGRLVHGEIPSTMRRWEDYMLDYLRIEQLLIIMASARPRECKPSGSRW